MYCILWQINEAKKRNLPYVYLGYWIQESRKINYKTQYLPAEVFRQDQWQWYSEKMDI